MDPFTAGLATLAALALCAALLSASTTRHTVATVSPSALRLGPSGGGGKITMSIERDSVSCYHAPDPTAFSRDPYDVPTEADQLVMDLTIPEIDLPPNTPDMDNAGRDAFDRLIRRSARCLLVEHPLHQTVLIKALFEEMAIASRRNPGLFDRLATARNRLSESHIESKARACGVSLN